MDIYNVTTINVSKDAFGRSTEGNNNVSIFELQPPYEQISFQFLPQELNWSRQPSWVSIPVPGRNNSYKQLTGGEDQLQFTLDFNSLFERDKDMCIKKFSFLQSLTIIDGPQRNVGLVWGDSELFRFKQWIVKSVGGRMSNFHRNFGMNPTQLYADIVLELDPKENQTLSTTRLSRAGETRNDYSATTNGITA